MNYKTKISRLETIRYFFDCHSFTEKGECPYGDNCKYAHGNLELTERLEMANIDKIKRILEQRGLCHEYLESGECKYGQNCKFAHARGEEAKCIEVRLEKKKLKKLKKLTYNASKKLDSLSLGNEEDEDQIDLDDKYEEDFKTWITKKLKESPFYMCKTILYDKAIDIIVAWKERYANDPSIFSRFLKGRGYDV